jgi:dihydroceramide fatty acyl 2-hydroxylase
VGGTEETSTAPGPSLLADLPPSILLDRAQVGHLGPLYWTWVNQPEAGKPRFFDNPFAESCTNCPWWVVPLVWLPLFTMVLAYSHAALEVSLPALAAWVIVGVVAWQGLEYLIHRCVFHADLSSYWGITFHFLFHGCHHKYPMDGERLVFPPVPASMLVAAVYAVLVGTLQLRHALPLFAGMGYGYVAYDCIHYALHCSNKGVRRFLLLRELQRRHLHHHYRDHSRGYGISSPLYDLLLGTTAANL